MHKQSITPIRGYLFYVLFVPAIAFAQPISLSPDITVELMAFDTTLDLNTYKGLHRKPPGPSCCGLF